MSILFICGFIVGAIFFFSISFLELKPRYLCYNALGKTYECKPEQFCGRDIKYVVDWEYYASLHNWVEDLDLTCTPKSTIGLIGSIFFAGWAVSATFLPRLSDIHGRKKMYIISMSGLFLLYLATLFSRNLVLTIVIMFFFGGVSVGRASIGFLYLMEFIPLKQQTVVGTFLQVFNSATTITACFYFVYISKYWLWFQMVGCAINLIVVICLFYVPESPKYLISKNRFDDARKALAAIAKINKYQGKINFKFDREVPL